jgi:hypothetical protein
VHVRSVAIKGSPATSSKPVCSFEPTAAKRDFDSLVFVYHGPGVLIHSNDAKPSLRALRTPEAEFWIGDDMVANLHSGHENSP